LIDELTSGAQVKVNKSITVTDLPGGVTLEAVREGYLMVVPNGEDGWTFSRDELTEIRDALNTILGEAPGQNRPTGPWAHLKDIPASISRVWDRDGDPYDRLSGGQWDVGSEDYSSQHYGPFRAQP
jgi:hypothetical protein